MLAPAVLGDVPLMHRARASSQSHPGPSSAGPPSSTTGLEGRVLGGRYLIRGRVGQGAMGRIYVAEHLELGRTCAVKVIRHRDEWPEPAPADGRDTVRMPGGEAVARFRVEALAASRLDHVNVLRVLDFGREMDDGLWYLVTEHLDGEDLLDVLSGERIPSLPRILAISRQLCAALQHAHDRGVVHRDVKPENVRLVPREEDDGRLVEHVKILDFGTARILEGTPDMDVEALERVVIGTPAYMSPEQASGEPADGRADLYSLGVVLFEMATGRLPFERTSPIALAAAHVECPPPAPSSIHDAVDPELESIILWCLRKKPSDRPQSARELREALERVGERAAGRATTRASEQPLAALAPPAPRVLSALDLEPNPDFHRTPARTAPSAVATSTAPTRPIAPIRRSKPRRAMPVAAAAIALGAAAWAGLGGPSTGDAASAGATPIRERSPLLRVEARARPLAPAADERGDERDEATDELRAAATTEPPSLLAPADAASTLTPPRPALAVGTYVVPDHPRAPARAEPPSPAGSDAALDPRTPPPVGPR